ncbi:MULTISPECIES: hypothetical protein [Kitasatospora]|uniref:Uncharacterized protein n=1 Tax=Kitasatospora setae (strain ATCC 33774 / DSM 43861 / JCM 3304 / KCC A-0304 / NBRC 14216 / KM-6054) TaxID=452652 RepID=E4N3G5_KITSK|nr:MULTISPECIES: hypothetical protein [Kitasatospora]BAJ32699.1 hypothetical protein KSE_69410 [Kitasatospora setae KM-6054]
MSADARLLEWALRFHPPRYRAEFGPDLTEAALASLAGRPRLAVLAEAAQLASHGLRLRLGLGADRPLGRAAAGAAPAVLALAAAGQAAHLLLESRVFGSVLPPDQLARTFGTRPAWAGVALTAVALFALLLGRVGTARLLGTAALAAAGLAAALTAPHWLAGAVGEPFTALLNPLAACLFLWLAPLRLTPAPGRRSALAALALGAGGTALLVAAPVVGGQGLPAVVAVLAYGLVDRGTRRAALTGLVALLPLYPALLGGFVPHHPSPFGVVRTVLVAAVAAAVLLVARRRARRPS